MDVTIDLKAFFFVLVMIALIVLIIFTILLVRKLMVTLEHTNKVLEDFEVVSEIAAARSQDADNIISDVCQGSLPTFPMRSEEIRESWQPFQALRNQWHRLWE